MRSGRERKQRRRDKIANAKREGDFFYIPRFFNPFTDFAPGKIIPVDKVSEPQPLTGVLTAETIRDAVKKMKAASEKPYIPF